MAGVSERQGGGLGKYIALLFLGGWASLVIAFALIMRAWVPEDDLDAKLKAMQEADTVAVDPEGTANATLEPLTEPIPALATSGSTYVPLYNDLYMGGERSLKNTSATLSMRNTSTDHPLIVESITLFDEAGQPVVERLETPHRLAPMGTALLYIDQTRMSDTPVKLAVVRWGAEDDVPAPLVAAVILGHYGVRDLSFISQGQHRLD